MPRPTSKYLYHKNSIPIELTDSPIVRRVSKISPASAIPKEDTTVGDAGVGTTTKRIESNALWTLNLVYESDLGVLEQILVVSLLGERR